MTDRIQEFIVEAREHLGAIEECLLALEKQISANAVAGLIDRAFRSIHSIKGDAGFLGLRQIHELAHAMETLLQHTQAPIEAKVIELLFFARDWLAVLVDNARQTNSIDIDEILNQLKTLAVRPSSTQFELNLDEWTEIGLVQLFRQIEASQQVPVGRLEFGDCDLRQCLPSGPLRWVTSVEVSLPITKGKSSVSAAPASAIRSRTERLNADLSHWSERFGGLSKPIHKLSDVAKRIEGHLLFLHNDLRQSLPRAPVVWEFECETGIDRDTLVRDHDLTVPADRLNSAKTTDKSAPSTSDQPTPQVRSSASTPRTLPHFTGTEKASTLRIQVELLDQLMTLVGELTLVRNQSLLIFAEENGSQRAILQRLNSVTSELQDVTLRARMQSISTLFNKFPRMVRDLARQLGKDVELELRGGEVEVDKTILEHLSDPLMHLIRNSVDHGIELPNDRVAKGKPPAGQIVLSAVHDDGQVYIQISDDGRGIDAAAVKAKAIRQGLKSPSEIDQMSMKELHSLILLPGFSTASNVSEVSGRGVGMDVVKTNIEKLEGTISIDSVQGHGCSIGLRLPLTLAIVPCLIVVVDDDRFALPQRDLVEIVILHPSLADRIEQAFDTEVFRLRNRLIPVIRMSDVLSRKSPFSARDKAEMLEARRSQAPSGTIEYLLILRQNGKRFGLVVDDVKEMQEIVVKPMHPSMKRVAIFAGATIMGDGSVALITDTEGIVGHARLSFESASDSAAATSIRDADQVHRVLIFESGPDERFALPLLQIRRVEMISALDIERVGSSEYVVVEGVSTRILRLDQHLDVSQIDSDPTMLSLILPKFLSHPMGILASRIVDTESLSLDLQQHSDQSQGILGSSLVQGRMTLFLDLHRLYQKLFDLEESLANFSPQTERRRKRLLLIDDTAFFREVVKRYLSAEGYEVQTAHHGREGLDRLESDGLFDLIVSDIEMPVMDGWEFAREARRRGIVIPMLALSSLSGSQYESKARDCGYDDYEVKLDHDRLVRKVSSLLSQKEVTA